MPGYCLQVGSPAKSDYKKSYARTDIFKKACHAGK